LSEERSDTCALAIAAPEGSSRVPAMERAGFWSGGRLAAIALAGRSTVCADGAAGNTKPTAATIIQEK
jgi:hypothetical protein